MTRKRGQRITALATLLLLLVIALLAIVMWFGSNSPFDPYGTPELTLGLMLLALPSVGWVVAIRQPQNPLGWVFLCIPIVLGVGAICEELGLRMALSDSDSAAAILLIVGGLFQFLGYSMLIGPAIWLFPDGRMPSNRFRWAVWGLAALVLVWAVVYVTGIASKCVVRFGVPNNPCDHSLKNPWGLLAGTGLERAADTPFFVIFLLTLIVSVIALVMRYARSTGEIRQQIKWVAWVTAAGLMAILALSIVQDMLGLFESIWADVLTLSLIAVGLPLAIGFSILKYRLYDIDRIISRSASYAVIIAILAAVYLVSVALLQRLLPVRGQLGIVVSTLLVAAMFSPLRRRVQNAVDRRFNRSRYDAKRVLDKFSSQLRDDVDLEQMQAALLTAAQEAMQPSILSLWIRERSR